MISNYIKLAWRVLARRKFFTFISLFGISFTLGILMIIFSFLQGELGNNSPNSNKDDLILIETLRLQRVHLDTIPVIDTVMVNGVEVFDTTMETRSRGSSRWNSSMNNGIGEEFLSDLPSSINQTLFTNAEYDVYVNGVKVSLETLYADANYWEVFDHDILEGRVFDKVEMEQADQVMVISTKTAKEYFGTTENVVDREIELDGKNFKVIGLYEDKGKIIPFISPDLVIPYSNMTLANQDSYYHGYFNMVLQKEPGADPDVLKKEIETAATLVPMDHPTKPDGYNELIFMSKTYNEMYAQGIYGDEDASKSLSVMKWVLLGLLSFFIVLPTLNLINLNVSRIMERSSEIGVRKAFGASQGNIVLQFVIENIIQTTLGGLIGLGIAIAYIKIFNNSGFLGSSTMVFNTKFFIYSFLITIVFGAVSGFLPAYRMSKLNIVNALKENKL